MFCMAGGFIVFLFLSKSVKIIVPSAIIGGLFFFFLAFTNIGQGNQQIRRMRSAFSKGDASTKVRDINQETMKKYKALNLKIFETDKNGTITITTDGKNYEVKPEQGAEQ